MLTNYKIQNPECYHLIELDYEGKNELVLLENSTYSIGRDPSNDIVIDSIAVSRQHAILLRISIDQSENHIFRIVDGDLKGKRSTNGIHINGRQQKSYILKHGDFIDFGKGIKATYYNFHAQPGLTSTEAIKLILSSTNTDNPEIFETVILDQGESEFADEALIHLASFPELIPHPILEVDISGRITYQNPKAIKLFPEIREIGKQHPILTAAFKALNAPDTSKPFSCEVRHQGHYYEESVHFFPESDLLRIFITDSTKNKTAEQARIQAEKKYQSIFENAIEGIFQTTLEGQYITVNPALAEIYGYSSPSEMMLTIREIGTQIYCNPNRRQQFIKQILDQGYVHDFESQICRKDGSIIWISENARIVCDEGGKCIGFEGFVQNITSRKKVESELLRREHVSQAVSKVANHLLTNPEFHKAIVSSLNTIGEALDADYLVLCQIFPNPDFAKATLGLEAEWFAEDASLAVTNQFWEQHPCHYFEITSWVEDLQAGQPVRAGREESSPGKSFFLTASGIKSLMLVPIFVSEKLWGFLGSASCQKPRVWCNHDESALFTIAASVGGAIHRLQVEDSIRHRALHDALTNLPNRTLFNEQLMFALNNAQRHPCNLAVMFLDLDRFKIINDTLGHTIGDLLLQEVAQRLTKAVRAGDIVARWGGDEFIILIPKLHEAKEIHPLAERILKSLEQVFMIQDHELYITSSIGIALFDATTPDADTLIKRADIALYHVKENGRNGHEVYDRSMDSKAPEILILERDLRHALDRDEFQILYQPRVNLLNREIDGMEALLRWHHPAMGVISPAKFIPIAEDNGLIIKIGKWVLQQACAQNKQWQEAGYVPIRVAVNLSPLQFRQSDLVDMITKVLDETGLAPAYLELEITETAAVQNIEFTRDVFNKLDRMGVHLSIDDFGTGHSSLNRLQSLPLNYLKIDKSFVQDLDSNSKVAHIISTIVALGKNLGLKIVAEGVETELQHEFLKSVQCETAQGFLFHRPISIEGAERLLTKIESSIC
jgi:diguanylate cyclase (GGDEF)-like protein/PAS domain S-box-containing protein